MSTPPLSFVVCGGSAIGPYVRDYTLLHASVALKKTCLEQAQRGHTACRFEVPDGFSGMRCAFEQVVSDLNLQMEFCPLDFMVSRDRYEVQWGVEFMWPSRIFAE